MLDLLDLENRVKMIPFQGYKLLHLDFSGCACEAAIQIIDYARPVIDRQPAKSIYTFSDFTNVSLKPDIIVPVSGFAKANEPHVRAGVVVGLTATNRFILNTVNKVAQRDLRAFADPVAAKAWLAGQK